MITNQTRSCSARESSNSPFTSSIMDTDPSGSGQWRFAQAFGDKGDVEEITEGTNYICYHRTPHSHHSSSLTTADIISTVEFDHTGHYLVTGDKGGRVVLFERNDTVSTSNLAYLLRSSISRKRVASTNFIQNFNRTNQNLIISNLSKSKKKLTRSNGVGGRILRTFSYPRTVS